MMNDEEKEKVRILHHFHLGTSREDAKGDGTRTETEIKLMQMNQCYDEKVRRAD
jgi:hypothetical protein